MSFQRGGPPGRDRPPANQAPARDPFWESYLKDGYLDEAGNLRPRLIVEDAVGVAQQLSNERPELTTGQLRRFYNKAKALEQKLAAGVPFPALVPQLKTLQPLATEAVAKEKAPQRFRTFIDKNMRWAVVDQKSFQEGFLVHFQSVVAYFAYEKKSGGGR